MLYRLKDGDARGWWYVDGSADVPPPDPPWRPATRRERAWYYLTTERFSWIDLMVIVVITQGLIIPIFRGFWR